MLWLVGLSIVWTASGCRLVPVANAGFVNLTPARPGKVRVELDGAGGVPYLGGGVAHVEPFVTSRLSLPISLVVIPEGTGVRLGVRHRFGSVVGVGAGITPGFAFGSSTIEKPTLDFGDDDEEINEAEGYVLLDAELLVGYSWRRVGLSFATRPMACLPDRTLGWGAEFAFAVFAGADWGVSLFVHGGLGFYQDPDDGDWVPFGPSLGGGLGVFGRL